MTPKEKAQELIDKFMPHSSGDSNNNEAKKCALIAVDEILFIVSKYNDTQAEVAYWKEVKQEIEKL